MVLNFFVLISILMENNFNFAVYLSDPRWKEVVSLLELNKNRPIYAQIWDLTKNKIKKTALNLMF